MAQIINPSTGLLVFNGMGVGFPGLHNTAEAAGDGGLQHIKEIYYLMGIAGNAVAASVNSVFWDMETGFVSLSDMPFSYTFFLIEERINENRSAVCHGMIGGLPSTSAVLDFDQWRLDTTRKRVGIITERNAAGIITRYLSWSDAVTQNSITMPALPNRSWVTVRYVPVPKSAEVFVNGALHARTASGDLPTGIHTGIRLFQIAALKRLASAPEVSLRHFAPVLLPMRTV